MKGTLSRNYQTGPALPLGVTTGPKRKLAFSKLLTDSGITSKEPAGQGILQQARPARKETKTLNTTAELLQKHESGATDSIIIWFLP